MEDATLRVDSDDIVVRGVRSFRRTTAMVLAASVLVAILLGLLPKGTVPEPGGALLWLAAVLGAVTSAATLASSHLFHDPTLATARTRGRRGHVEVTDHAILVHRSGATARYPRDRIAAGWLEPVAEGHAVVLRMADGDLISVRVADAEAADALLRAAGVSAERMALRMRLPSRAERQPAGRISAVFQLLLLGLFALPCLAAFAWVVWQMVAGHHAVAPMLGVVGSAVGISIMLLFRILAMLASPSVVVGAEGISIHEGRRRRYIPYRDVTSVQKYPLGVRLRTRRGEAIVLDTWTRATAASARGATAPKMAELDGARRDVLYERIHSAMGSGGGDLGSAELSLLDRGGKSVERWREDLGRLLEGAAYRQVGLDRSALEQVLSDPAASPSRRVAAAFALSKADDRALHERARIVTNACADERLRVAITRAVDGQLDDEIAEELEAEPRARTRRA